MTHIQREDSTWTTLYRIGGAAAVIAALLFRRNLGAEVTLLSGRMPPVAVSDWLALLANDRLLGLAFLNVFDIVNYALVGLIFIGLYAALRRSYPGTAGLAACFGLIGGGVYFASNQAFAMLSLSNQYAAASEAQRATLVATGEALLAIDQGTGIYASLFLVTLAGLIFSVLMLRSRVFNRLTAYIGILAHVLLMGYFVLLPIAPSLVFLPHVLAAVPLVIWQLLSGWRLIQLARDVPKGAADAR